jgi:hypothetical protein
VFGGGANGSAYKDAFGLTLPLDGSVPAWHTLSPTTSITARDQVTVALDRDVLTAFGGFGSGTFPGSVGAGTHLADTWQRDLRRRAGWRLATPADETQVAIAREGTAYAHDAENHRLLMFGGLTGDTTLSDVWMADLRRPGGPRWEQLCSTTSCGPGPTTRWGPKPSTTPSPTASSCSVDRRAPGPPRTTFGRSTCPVHRRGAN